MINVDIFDDEAKAKTARATYQAMGRRAELFNGLGMTVDDRRPDPDENIFADGTKIWTVVAE